jgi:hypothetical protein
MNYIDLIRQSEDLVTAGMSPARLWWRNYVYEGCSKCMVEIPF